MICQGSENFIHYFDYTTRFREMLGMLGQRGIDRISYDYVKLEMGNGSLG